MLEWISNVVQSIFVDIELCISPGQPETGQWAPALPCYHRKGERKRENHPSPDPGGLHISCSSTFKRPHPLSRRQTARWRHCFNPPDQDFRRQKRLIPPIDLRAASEIPVPGTSRSPRNPEKEHCCVICRFIFVVNGTSSQVCRCCESLRRNSAIHIYPFSISLKQKPWRFKEIKLSYSPIVDG